MDVLRALVQDRRDLRLSQLSEHGVDWALASGLGPAVLRAVELDSVARSLSAWERLYAADLTARALSAHQTAAVTALIDGCQRQGIPVTLLKGIAVCDAYPSPHLRPMRDIDILVPAPLVPAALAVGRELGYEDDPAATPGAYDHHHHAVPLVHRDTEIWLEVHHRLFPSGAPLHGEDPFTPELVAASTQPAMYHGRVVGRLSPSLELPYLASHWARSGKPIVGPGGVLGLLDLAMLSGRLGRSEWSDVRGAVEGTLAARYLSFVLEFLADRGLVDKEALAVAGRDNGPGARVRRWVAHTIIERHIVEGVRPGGGAWLRGIEVLWASVLPGVASVRR